MRSSVLMAATINCFLKLTVFVIILQKAFTCVTTVDYGLQGFSQFGNREFGYYEDYLNAAQEHHQPHSTLTSNKVLNWERLLNR